MEHEGWPQSLYTPPSGKGSRFPLPGIRGGSHDLLLKGMQPKRPSGTSGTRSQGLQLPPSLLETSQSGKVRGGSPRTLQGPHGGALVRHPHQGPGQVRDAVLDAPDQPTQQMGITK